MYIRGVPKQQLVILCLSWGGSTIPIAILSGKIEVSEIQRGALDTSFGCTWLIFLCNLRYYLTTFFALFRVKSFMLMSLQRKYVKIESISMCKSFKGLMDKVISWLTDVYLLQPHDHLHTLTVQTIYLHYFSTISMAKTSESHAMEQ